MLDFYDSNSEHREIPIQRILLLVSLGWEYRRLWCSLGRAKRRHTLCPVGRVPLWDGCGHL